MKRNTFIPLSLIFGWLACALPSCEEDINNYEKQTEAEASNKVFFNEKYATVEYNAYRTTEGKVTNLDTLVAKLVIGCSEPAGGDLTVKVNIDTLLVEVYNKAKGRNCRQFMSNWIKLNRSSFTIPQGATEASDTLVVSLTKPLDSESLSSTDGYVMPIRINSASGYDTQVDFNRRISYLVLDVTQENGIGFESGNNSVMLSAETGFTGYDVPFVSYVASNADIDVEMEIDNDLVAEFNSQYGTDFKTISAEDFELPSFKMEAGNTTAKAQILYNGDAAALESTNYMVPVRIKSATEAGASVKKLQTDTYYILANRAARCTLVQDESLMGVKQTDRSAYSAISSALKFTVGSWSSMFKGQQWVLNVPGSVIVNLGKEVENITGFLLQASGTSMRPAKIDVSYTNENLYKAYPSVSISLGTVKPTAAKTYVKFDTPITARYIELNNMTYLKNYYSCTNFYIFTQE